MLKSKLEIESHQIAPFFSPGGPRAAPRTQRNPHKTVSVQRSVFNSINKSSTIVLCPPQKWSFAGLDRDRGASHSSDGQVPPLDAFAEAHPLVWNIGNWGFVVAGSFISSFFSTGTLCRAPRTSTGVLPAPRGLGTRPRAPARHGTLNPSWRGGQICSV